MKPAIAFAVVRRVYMPGWCVLSITSENRSRVFGRDETETSTNRAHRDILARFPTYDTAKLACTAAQEAWNAHAQIVKDAERAETRARHHRDEAVQRAIEGVRARYDAKGEPTTPEGVDPLAGATTSACNEPT